MYPNGNSADTVYTFSIGSIEAFERKLDEAQTELGIPSSERVPVAYVESGQWLDRIFTFAPTLIFIAFSVWAFRQAGKSLMGGMGGRLDVGKSKAKRFNVRPVSHTHVCCWP
jgi:AFG3 family protein